MVSRSKFKYYVTLFMDVLSVSVWKPVSRNGRTSMHAPCKLLGRTLCMIRTHTARSDVEIKLIKNEIVSSCERVRELLVTRKFGFCVDTEIRQICEWRVSEGRVGCLSFDFVEIWTLQSCFLKASYFFSWRSCYVLSLPDDVKPFWERHSSWSWSIRDTGLMSGN